MEKRIGSLAYKLKLLATSTIHPIIHVSQLRKAIPPSTPVQARLPEGTEEVQFPIKVLQRRLRDKGATAATQVLVQWSGSTLATMT